MTIQITIGQAASTGLIAPPVIAAIITALVTILTGGFIVYYSRRQAMTAADKVALDMFDRRLANFQIWRRLLNDQLQQVYGRTSIDDSLVSLKYAAEFQTSSSDARFLFGKDVHKHIMMLAGTLDLMDAHPGFTIDKEGWTTLDKTYRDEWTALRVKIDDFLLLDRVGVGPRRRDLKPANEYVFENPA